jgi:biopolymer transport protein ExbD
MKIRRGIKQQPRIEMLPLIDIVFLLLVFFIYAMLSMSVHRSQPVQLPSSRSVQIDTSKAITVTLQDHGGNIVIFVDDKEVSLDLLSTVLQQRNEKQSKEKSKVQVYGDKSVSYQDLFQVLDRIKSTGIRDISLAAEEQPDTK